MFFHVWEKWYIQSEATEVCEFRAKITAFYCSLHRRFAHIQREKFYSKSFSPEKSEKHFGNGVEVDKENGRVPTKQQRKGKNRTRRKLLLCFLSDLLCLSFKLKHILNPAILLKFIHFQLCIENKQLRLLIVLGLPHILTIIYVFNKCFY